MPRTRDVTQPIARIAPRQRQYGDYRLLARVSRGGTCEVHLAEHARTGERVAVKILERHHDAGMTQRLFAEKTVSERVRHAGLLQVHEAGCGTDERAYIAMEYLDGENLGELAERGLLDCGAVIAIARQVAAAIAALHGAGIAHCDLKPSNIFVLYDTATDGWPRIKVIDYGVAVLPDGEPLDEGTIAGTPHYMAPEQWAGEPRLESDVYSLGCMLFELLTGDTPFFGSLPSLMAQHRENLAPRATTRRSQIPSELDGLIARMLLKEPAMRPSMHEIELELARIARSLVERDDEARAAG